MTWYLVKRKANFTFTFAFISLNIQNAKNWFRAVIIQNYAKFMCMLLQHFVCIILNGKFSGTMYESL